MNLTKLEKATKLMKRMKEVDKEIIEIESLANLIINKPTEIKLKLSIKDLDPPKKDKEKILDDDGSLTTGQSSPYGSFSTWGILAGMSGAGTKKEEDKDVTKLSSTLSDTTTLQVLGILLQQKQEIREAIFREFERIGVTV